MESKDRIRRMREKAIVKSKEAMKESIGKDKVIAQAVSAIDDLSEISNLLSERLHEWYGLHHPELKANDNKKYAKSILDSKERKNSTGIDLDDNDMKAVIQHATFTKTSFDIKDSLENYVKDSMKEMAPNLNSTASPIIGAKLIALAGSIEKLAKMPASTIQLLGAEKALFRFIKAKKQGNPPKYGIIFMHEHVQNAKNDNRGKVARLLASKISMAAKTDFYTDEDKSEYYKRELDRKLRELK